MKKFFCFVLALGFLLVSTQAFAWKDKEVDEFDIGNGASVKTISVDRGGWFFRRPSSVDVVAESQPESREVTKTVVTKTYKEKHRIGGCPDPSQTREVGNREFEETTTTLATAKKPAKSQVVFVKASSGKAPLETYGQIIGDVAKAASFPVGMHLRKPDVTKISTSGGTQTTTTGPVAATGTATGGKGGDATTGPIKININNEANSDSKSIVDSDQTTKVNVDNSGSYDPCGG